MTTSVLVTGANGYIAGEVCFALRAAGFKVYGLVRDEAQGARLLRAEVIPIVGDTSHPEAFEAQLVEASVVIDCVPYNAKRSNGFFSFVESLARTVAHALTPKSKSFVWTSGVNDYGNNPSRIVDETTPPRGEGEYFGGRISFTKTVTSSPDVHGVVFRPGYVYGKSGGKLAGPLWFDTVVDGKLTIRGSRTRRFPWVHVSDLAQAYVCLLTAPKSAVAGTIYNIVDYSSPTLEELKLEGAKLQGFVRNGATAVLKPLTVEYQEEFHHDDFEANFVNHIVINPQRAVDVLHWKPRHMGLQHEMALYYMSWRTAYRSSGAFK